MVRPQRTTHQQARTKRYLHHQSQEMDTMKNLLSDALTWMAGAPSTLSQADVRDGENTQVVEINHR